ncbi:hypothetical protein O9992_23565 [Vibrio lentus]|nr:hypothetical protein [Vibrio lentus]
MKAKWYKNKPYPYTLKILLTAAIRTFTSTIPAETYKALKKTNFLFLGEVRFIAT